MTNIVISNGVQGIFLINYTSPVLFVGVVFDAALCVRHDKYRIAVVTFAFPSPDLATGCPLELSP